MTLPHSKKFKNILLVEDDRLNQKITQSMMLQLGYDLEIASTGEQAIDMFHQKKYDLVLLDIGLPDIDGVDLAKIFRKEDETHSRHTPIIAVTAHVRESDKHNCLAAGMDQFVSKPIMMDNLIHSMEAVGA